MNNKQRSLAYNGAKKRKILLGTLIPAACLVVAAAVVIPVALTQCKDRGLKLEIQGGRTIDENNKTITFSLKNVKDKSTITYDYSYSYLEYLNFRGTPQQETAELELVGDLPVNEKQVVITINADDKIFTPQITIAAHLSPPPVVAHTADGTD
ncbi:hypothetical protein FACS1894166_06010 [Bacilli bacterium]|nr:hypothetical protein FACS1894166_06010 [Bacilli bacterium]